MVDKAALNEILLQVGDSLVVAASDAQLKYDHCENPEDFQQAKMLRGLLLRQIPAILTDIHNKLCDKSIFDFWGWYQDKRGADDISQMLVSQKKMTLWARVKLAFTIIFTR